MIWRPLVPCDARALDAALAALGLRVDRHPLAAAVADNRADEERRRLTDPAAARLPYAAVVG